MNDERYILARFKMMLLDRISKGKKNYDWDVDIYKEVLVLLNAIEVTAVLDEDVDVILAPKQEEES